MPSLDYIVQPRIDPAASVATDRYLMGVLSASPRPPEGFLRIYSMPGDVLSLGRYHLAPGAPLASGVTLCRRPSGGRALPFGDGFVGLSLILPHRSALVADVPLALAPHQVLNRYVRGLLETCRRQGLAVLYPGRDFVTIDRRVVAAVGFETDERGVLLVEALIAATRDFGLLPQFLDAVDREGVVKAEVLAAARTTSLAAELRSAPSFATVAEMLGDGYARQFGLRLEPRELTEPQREAIAALAAGELRAERWVFGRGREPLLDRHVVAWTQLGAFEAHFSLEQESVIGEIIFAGDFIANSAAIEALERELRSCPVDARAIHAVVNRIFSRPENYLLGIGPLDAISDMIVRGLRP